jgi:uncharacterized secreted protein with C-terminal beta-propeller domain
MTARTAARPTPAARLTLTARPTPATRLRLTARLTLTAGLALLVGCTATPSRSTPPSSARAFKLVAFTSCDDLLAGLRAAAEATVGPYGLSQEMIYNNGALKDNAAKADAAPRATAGSASAPDHSVTNTAEPGVDEPDVVKTDGNRIVTVTGGVLRVVDAASRRITGSLNVGAVGSPRIGGIALTRGDGLLLSGDRALVLLGSGGAGDIAGPRLLLVDLAGGTPRLAASYAIDGGLVDARQSGSTVRVVIRSTPRVAFPQLDNATEDQRLAANRAAIDRAGADDWLPRYEVSAGGQTSRGRVDCAAVSRPAQYSGFAMLSLLTFDLGKAALASGDPVTIVADGNTVYANGSSLYVANDNRWRAQPLLLPGGTGSPPAPATELYQFDTSGTGRPRYLAAGTVPGWLINQYALSEWGGNLRVATTESRVASVAGGAPTGQGTTGQDKPGQGTTGQDKPGQGTTGKDGTTGQDVPTSTVYLLRRSGATLGQVGAVGGLGKGQRIYAVRFDGPVGYVVTFRQTDPLYVLDLRDPAHPSVTGALEINGYSAYLHPAGDGRLIGVGQAADAAGRIQGAQVSLFDVANPAAPRRVAQHQVRYGRSSVEFDPHAFLYWPATGLLVVPITSQVGAAAKVGGAPVATDPAGTALALRISGATMTEAGSVAHPAGVITRSLVIDRTLWTVSDAGLAVNDLTALTRLGWLPY